MKFRAIIVLLAMLFAPVEPAAAAAKCKALITRCGCVLRSAKRYKIANPLSSTSITADCLKIAAAHAVLDLNGMDILGPGSGSINGIHVLSSANGAYIDGESRALVTKFETGILIDASDVVVFGIELLGNQQFGLVINGGSRNALYDSAAAASNSVAGNGIAGVMINKGSANLINDIFAERNGKYGIEIRGGANNYLHDLDGDSNGIYGLWINGSSGNRIVNSTGRNNQQIGIYIGCAPTGGPGGKCPAPAAASGNVVDFTAAEFNGINGIAIDKGDLSNRIGLNTIINNGSTDAIDLNPGCGTNLWFINQIGAAASNCIN